MASQTIQDIKAIYAAAKAKFNSLPEDNKLRVHIFFMQCILAIGVTLVVVFSALIIQMHLLSEAADQAYKDASGMRWHYELLLRDARGSK